MSIYYCTFGEQNTCPQKDMCIRYRETDKDNPLPFTTLYKEMCNENNQYVLFIPDREKIENNIENQLIDEEIRGEED